MHIFWVDARKNLTQGKSYPILEPQSLLKGNQMMITLDIAEIHEAIRNYLSDYVTCNHGFVENCEFDWYIQDGEPWNLEVKQGKAKEQK